MYVYVYIYITTSNYSSVELYFFAAKRSSVESYLWAHRCWSQCIFQAETRVSSAGERDTILSILLDKTATPIPFEVPFVLNRADGAPSETHYLKSWSETCKISDNSAVLQASTQALSFRRPVGSSFPFLRPLWGQGCMQYLPPGLVVDRTLWSQRDLQWSAKLSATVEHDKCDVAPELRQGVGPWMFLAVLSSS